MFNGHVLPCWALVESNNGNETCVWLLRIISTCSTKHGILLYYDFSMRLKGSFMGSCSTTVGSFYLDAHIITMLTVEEAESYRVMCSLAGGSEPCG